MKRSWDFWASAAWLISITLMALCLPILIPSDPYTPVGDPLLPPHLSPPLGTDALGRDFMSRLIFGARTTLMAGSLAASITILSGIALSLLTTISPRWIDQLILGGVNAALAIPGLIFALLLSASMGPGFRTVILAVGFGLVPGYTRLARSVFQQVKQAEYIQAARSLGMSTPRIALYHILPNAIIGVSSFSALHFSWAILGIITLTFLGMSGDPSIPEWGAMLEAGRQQLQIAPHLALIPGGLISLTILAVYRLSEELK